MATPATTIERHGIHPSVNTRIRVVPAPQTTRALPAGHQSQAFEMTAQSIQFVAIPGKTRQLQSTLPRAIEENFQGVAGFTGCMVMVSDQEARLVTVVTFWTGTERSQLCSETAEQLRLLLFTYVDGCLRTEKCIAHCSIAVPAGIGF